MKTNTLEKTNLIYFTDRDDWSNLEVFDLKIYDLSHFRRLELKIEADVRLILIIAPWDINKATLNYLYWNNNQNLEELDNRVENNTWMDEDFYASIITRYQKTKCFNCERTWNTLVTDELSYLGGGLELPTIKFRQFSQNIKPCPHCGSSLRQSVVKIF
jgi:hypothetical protein